jgi:hypothetical protein
MALKPDALTWQEYANMLEARAEKAERRLEQAKTYAVFFSHNAPMPDMRREAKDWLAAAEVRLERTCEWKHDADYGETGCGHEWQFVDGGPKENGAAFCYACGGRLVVAAQNERER